MVRTSKSVLMISVNPSDSLGSRYLEAKPVKASLGKIVRSSGFICGNCQYRSLVRFVKKHFERSVLFLTAFLG